MGATAAGEIARSRLGNCRVVFSRGITISDSYFSKYITLDVVLDRGKCRRWKSTEPYKENVLLIVGYYQELLGNI